MEAVHDVVVVGGGLAAAKAVETLRTEGFDGRLTMVADEEVRPYERPPLSKGVLVGEDDEDSIFVHAASYYEDHDVELVRGDAAIRIDRDAGNVTTASGRTFGFERLLLATGAAPRRLPLSERDLEGLMTFRNVDDALRLRDRLASVSHVTVVGAGWIGCEVAAAARTRGVDVTLVDPLESPLERVLGAELGGAFARLHRENGVELRLGKSVTGVRGDRRVEAVLLSDGSTVETELVVVGIGVVPRTELADEAGLQVDNGIVTDEFLATSDPRIFAAGDVANAWHPFYEQHLRVEHWANALNQGISAGRNLLGAAEPYDRLPYFYSDQYDLGMEYVGRATPTDRLILRGDLDQRKFVAFWLDGQTVVAAMNVNVWDVLEDCKQLIRSRTAVPVDVLGDTSVPLTDLLTGPS